MSIRIYALAKQLKIESKALVELCKQAGLSGKGSALASLTDEEVNQVKSHLAKGKQADTKAVVRAADPPVSGTVRREDYIGPASTSGSKVPVFKSKPRVVQEAPAPAPPVPPPPAPAEPISSEPAEELPPLVAEESVAPEAPVSVDSSPTEDLVEASTEATPTEAASTEAASTEAASTDEPEPTDASGADPTDVPPVPPAGISPPEFVRPPLESGKIRNLGRPGLKSDRLRKADKEKSERVGPTIKLAPLPKAKQIQTPKKNEPTPQKPDIRLPADAIRASKAGKKPLAEHLRKQEEKRKVAKTGGRKEAARPASGGSATEKATPDSAAARERESADKGKRGKGAKSAEGGVFLGGREQRQLRRKRTGSRSRRPGEDDDGPVRRVRALRRIGRGSTAAPRKSNVVVEMPCTVRSFSEALGLPANQVQRKILELGTMATINDTIDSEMAELLADSFDVAVTFRQEVDLESHWIGAVEEARDDPDRVVPRPPVVTFLGHVDHGKTSLLDKIIGIDVVAGEKGGITQHIRAYQVEKEGKAIAFVDTPGHEAFTAMRARGANCTDIAVLVVAVDDGVMPQTEEAISHARAAGVPIVVALNKIDLPGVNVDRVLQELATNELLPSEWGGDVEIVRTSAETGEGLDELLDTLLTVAELNEYQADPERAATGVCLEAEVQTGLGVVSKMLVQRGTLSVGDIVVCGAAHGRVKAMYDTLKPRKRHKSAGPSMPVNLTGMDVAPGAGDCFHVLTDVSKARQIAEERADRARQAGLVGTQPHITLENLFERFTEQQDTQTLNIILRADVRGSIEAIRKELGKLEHPEVQIKVLQATVGGVTEADVHLADASDAIIIAFNVVPDEKARVLADQLGVQVRRYDIIYQVTEDLKAALEGMLRPEKREADLGRALVQRVFHISRIGSIAGCRVLAGNVQRDARIRVIRENRIIGDYGLDSLRREKDDVREAREGMECGIKLASFNDLKEGDILEAYKIEEIARTL